MLIDVQFNSARNDWPTLRDAVRRAEADGVSCTWVFDHFDGHLLGGDRPVLECVALLGALAAATSTINIGPLVANVANRHPAVLAAAAASLQHISGGRLIVGIGAGAAPGSSWATEHQRLGIPLHDDITARHQAVSAQIAALRSVTDAPIIVGVNTVALSHIAGAEADGVNVRLDHPRAALFVAAARTAAGDRPCEVSAYTMLDSAAQRSRAADLGIDRLIVANMGALQ